MFDALCPLPLQTLQTYLIMMQIAWGHQDIWTFFVLALCFRLHMAQIEQYYAVSKDDFLAIVAKKCENLLFPSYRTTECPLLSSLLGRPRCFATALAPGSCWLCGENFAEIYMSSTMNEATQFWLHSGRCGNNMLSYSKDSW